MPNDQLKQTLQEVTSAPVSKDGDRQPHPAELIDEDLDDISGGLLDANGCAGMTCSIFND
jgi:hypothetical protein